MIEITIPRFGANDVTATLSEWTVKEGVEVKRGTILISVETAKSVFDIECPCDGFFCPFVESYETVKIGTIIGVISDTNDFSGIKEKYNKKNDLESKYTVGARKLIEQYKLDINLLPKDKIVREKDVIDILKNKDINNHTIKECKTVAIYGASIGGEVIYYYLKEFTNMQPVLFLDDDSSIKEFCNLPVICVEKLDILRDRGIDGIITHITNRQFRFKLLERANQAGISLPNLIHPSVTISNSVKIGVGNIIKAGAIIDVKSVISDMCIIDSGAVISHHNVIFSASQIAPGAVLGGDVMVGSRTLISTGSVVLSNVKIGSDSVVDTGSCVVQDVMNNVFVSGNPARVMGTNK